MTMDAGGNLVLLVEDEDSFIDALTLGLQREGFSVVVARDGAEALKVFDGVNPDMVLLDVMLPKVSGLDVCRELRSRSAVPIILVTAKSSELDTVVGLEVGADDYITKPYRLRELVARMRAVMRRRAPAQPNPVAAGFLTDASGNDVVEVGDVRIDHQRHEVTVRGAQVQLPLKEFELLAILLENAGRVLDTRPADGAGLGRRLRGRHQDPRRAHQASAGQGRSRPVRARPDRHHPRSRLQVQCARRLGRQAVELVRGLIDGRDRSMVPRRPWRRSDRLAPGPGASYTRCSPLIEPFTNRWFDVGCRPRTELAY